jgi:hypothetical protein
MKNMVATNFPEGFLGFQAQIEALTETLGGTDGVRIVIENQFNKSLRDIISIRLYGNTYANGGRYSGIWTAATNADFAAAFEDASRYYHVRLDRDPELRFVSPSLKVELVQRDTSLYLENGGHAIFLVHAYEDTHAAARIHPAQTTRRDPWEIAIMDSGKTILRALDRHVAKAAVQAQGRAGAVKSLIRFGELFV